MLAGFFAITHLLSADQAVITASADTTLIEAAPTNNLGAAGFVNAGTTQNFTKNRGLFKFDIASAVPRGSRITRVELLLEVTRSPADGYASSIFDLHRMLKSWGEGSQAEPLIFPGLGVIASANEATWRDRFAFAGQPWTAPGAAVGDDFSPTVTAEQIIYDVGDSPYFFGPTAQMTADVQGWLDDPASNHGWLLKTRDESVNFTARRFGAREDANRSPLLVIDYEPPLLVRISGLQSNQVCLSFQAQAERRYTIEGRTSLVATGAWQTLTNFDFAQTTNFSWCLSASEARLFLRVRQD